MTNERRNAEFLRSRQSIIVVIKSNCVHLNLKIKPSKIIQDRRIEKQICELKDVLFLFHW